MSPLDLPALLFAPHHEETAMYAISPTLYATPISGTLNYAVYDRDGGRGRARRIGTVKQFHTGAPAGPMLFAYFPKGHKRHGGTFATLSACLESLK